MCYAHRFAMPKFKPHKGLLKRVRITKSGKIKGRVANGSHLRSGKSATRLRDMRKPRYITNRGVLRRVEHLLGRRVKPTRVQPAAAQAT
jgi:large subunit ribosomal protein L35